MIFLGQFKMADHYDPDAERAGLVGGGSSTVPRGGGSGSKNIEWGKFGLSEDTNANTTSGSETGGLGGIESTQDSYQQGAGGEKIQELFDEQQQVK